MSEERILSDTVWTPARGENDPEIRSISWNNLLLSDEVYGGKFLTSAEIRVNPDTALQSTVFLACCRIISETVSSLPLLVYRRLKNGHEEVASDIPLSHVLGFAPNSWQTKFEFFEQMCMALTCWGNSYTEVKSGRYGSVTELNNLHPSRMRVERLENGRLKYSYNDPQTGRLLQYTQDQIMHVRWTPEPDGVKGMVPVEVSRDAVALSRACEIYASKFWANMGRPGIVLQTDGALSAETAERLRDNWERIHRGVQNAYKTAVLTNGLKVESFGATNNDSQFLEVRRFQCEEIARVFRLSLGLIQGNSTGGNLEVQGQEFINYTLMPWLIRIEQAISRSLIYDDATYYAKFDTRGLLRGDSNSRAAFYSTMLNLGILSINECRRAEGLGPLGPEADKHLVAMNLQPLEEAVKPKPDPSMMPGFGSGAPPKSPGGPPSLSEVKTGKAPIESPKGEDSAKRAEVRELLPQDEKLEEAHEEIAEEEGKWTKESAHYIEKNPFASRGIKCHNCTHYVEEGGCGIVSGLINGDAICKLWVIPQEKITQEPEQRAFCPTGEGGGVKNDCGSKGGGGGAVTAGEAAEKFERYRPFKSVGESKNSDHIRIPSDEEISSALKEADVQQSKIGASRELPEQTPVALRIDIPAWNKTEGKTYVVTVHEGKNPDNKKAFGSVIGYDSLARLSGPVRFSSNDEDRAQKVAEGKSKTPLATVNGSFSKSREVPSDIDSWTPVGYDPQKAVYFYDKKTGQEVVGGTDALSVGNTVFTREPKYGNRNAKTHYRSLEEMMAVDSWGLESRAFCPTGEGGGIDNSCGSGDGGGGTDSSGTGGGPRGGGGERAVSGRDVLKLLEKISQNPDGFTLDPANAEQPESGIMVSEFANDSRRSVKIKASEIKTAAGAEAFVKWFDGNADLLLGDSTRFVGGWKTGDDFYIDVATRFEPEDAEKALEAGRKSGQLAVFNLGTFKETWVKYEDGDGRKPKEWDSGFARARKDAASKQVYDESSPDMQDEDWSAELSQHGKKTVRYYNGESEEAVANERNSKVRRSEQADTHRDVSSVPGLSGEVVRGQGREARSGLVCGQPGGEAGTLQGSAASPEGRAFCPTGEGGGVDNSCSSKDGGSGKDGGSSKGNSSPRREIVNVAEQAISSPATVRSPDGKTIVSSSVGSREDGTIYRFAGREYVSTVAAGKHLTERQAESRGEAIDSAKPLSEKDREYVAESHAAQVQAAMDRGIKPVFYTPEERQRQIEEYARIEPRILGGRTKAGFEVSPENADFLFRAVQALTSSNATPFANMQRTDAVLSKFFDDDGRISTSTAFGVTGAAIKKSLSRLQAVVDTLGRRTDGSVDPVMGLDKTRELFVGTTMRVGDIDKFLRGEFAGSGPSVTSWKPSSYLVSQEVPLFSTFGPKFGPFFANNTGDPSHLTADIWATRTWGRITGELVQEAKSAKAKEHGKALMRVVKSANADQLHGVDGNQLVESIKKMAATGEIDDVVRAWSGARLRHYASTDYSEKRGTGGKLNKLAKNVAENDTSLMGDPGSGRRRANMIDVYRQIEKATGLPVAYAQDVLWQDEQDAYAALGAKTATEQGKLSFYSDEIRRIAEDQSYRIARAKRERRNDSGQPAEFYDDYERGGRENLLYWEMINHLSDEQFVKLLLDIDGRPAERRAFCPTGDGGGVDNSCPPETSGSSGGSSEQPRGSKVDAPENVKVSDKPEEIEKRLGSMGVTLDDTLSMAGGTRDGTQVFLRRDYDHDGQSGLHIECTRDVAGVKDGMFSVTVVRNAGTESSPEIIVDHKLMEVSSPIRSDPAKRHAAGREFYRSMTESVAAAIKRGASKVVLNAAGNPRQAKDGLFRGYTIWPRMGFDAPLPYHLRNKLPSDLSHCRTLLDLHATPTGTRWWRDNGTDLDVELDLKRADSPQMQVFGKFVRHFERDRRELAYGDGDGWLSPADQAKIDELWEEIWDEGLLDDYLGEEENFSQVGEKRAFCPTGDGGGVDNSCASGEGALDTSWKDSDEAVELWEKEDLADRSPIKGGEKLKSFAIENPAGMKSTLREVGVSLSDAVTMCAAPSEDTTVIISPEHPYDSMGLANFGEESDGLVFTMTTKDVSGITNALDSNASLRRTRSGELILEYHAFHASKEAQEKAAVACAKEIIGGVVKSISVAEKSRVSEIRLDAAGSKDHESFQGYRIWPKFGFDGVIPRKMLTRLREQDISPRALAEKRAGRLTIQALYETKAGQQYWEERGSEIPMWLRPGDETTPGWARFKAYRQRVGKLAESREFSPGNEIFSEEELEKLEELWAEFRREAAEKRAFCPTGEGGGIDNSCGGGGPRVMMAPDGAGGGGSSRWGGETQDWGKSADTETFTSRSPLFPGAENLASIRIYRPNDVKGIIEDELRLEISDAVLASGPIVESAKRAGITMPRLEITPGDFGGIDMHWTAMGVSTGEGFRGEEAMFAPTPGTAVKAAEASRRLTRERSGPSLYMSGFFIHPDFQGRGIALDSVLHSTSAPVVRLRMDAERLDSADPNLRMTGYSAWPRFGYDAPLSDVIFVLSQKGVTLPREYEKAKSLLGIYALPGGADFWRQHGGSIGLTFDARPRSMGREILLQLRDRKRKPEGRNMANDLGGQPVGVDSDFDPVVDEVWADIVSGKIKLTGTVPTQEEWDQWGSERTGAKDGDSGEVQPH